LKSVLSLKALLDRVDSISTAFRAAGHTDLLVPLKSLA